MALLIHWRHLPMAAMAGALSYTHVCMALWMEAGETILVRCASSLSATSRPNARTSLFENKHTMGCEVYLILYITRFTSQEKNLTIKASMRTVYLTYEKHSLLDRKKKQIKL